MSLSSLDWIIIFSFFALFLIIGLKVSKQAGSSAQEFFLSGRNMPWWLIGISMVATTFSADTPNLVTDIVRKNGVAGNWAWWAFLITGMVTVFIYAKLWRKSGVLTDLEFYEIRYGGKAARFLRGFRSIYLGVFFNVMIMATVMLAGIKIGSVLFDLPPLTSVLVASLVTVVYSSLGGLRGVILTDFLQFIIAMVGSLAAAIYVMNLPEVGGLEGLMNHPEVTGKLNILPDFSQPEAYIPLFLVPLAVQWWSVWYPGAEPGGGGYIAQRMLSAKNEKHAVLATLLFNVTHYALRPWPWIIIALVSLVMYPMNISNGNGNNGPIKISPNTETFLFDNVTNQDINTLANVIDIKRNQPGAEASRPDYNRLMAIVDNNTESLEVMSLAYIVTQKNAGNTDLATWSDPLEEESLVRLHLQNPQVDMSKLGHDLGYSNMLLSLPSGLLGIVVASLIAAFMSTISTHLNWGASYIVHDYYQRFVKPEATEKEKVNIGRLSTVGLMLLAGLLALALEDALGAFNILLQIGAGTGSIFILRWFWWRVNAWSEISGMIVSFVIALVFEFTELGLASHEKLVIGVLLTTITWLVVTLLTKPENDDTLKKFYNLVAPYGMGWNAFRKRMQSDGVELKQGTGKFSADLMAVILGVFLVYCALFATGMFIYGQMTYGLLLAAITLACTVGLIKIWKRLSF